jgi:predicted unusual protein kinase regulating ubiquinone biosynthesis (AarF/ABC1/UbiB family)
MSKPPSRFGRLASLGGLTSRVSSSYLGQRLVGAFQDEESRAAALRKLHIENAEKVAQTMGALKGAAMKVGQSLALAVDGMDLPPEISGILSKLNDRAEPVPFEDIRRTIEAELEAPLEQLYADFDTEPLGTASLAQAHAARLRDGRRVVVKALHPGVEHSVDTDLGALRSILITGRVLRRPKEELDAIFAEVRARLLEELDYYQEAANLEFFAHQMGHMPDVHIPRPHSSHSSGRVLTMDRLEGSSLDRFLPDSTSEARQKAGELIFRTFHDMFYRLRALHADPHGGNYLFRQDGGIGLVDFGCVRRFEMDWVAHYARMSLAAVDGDRRLLLSQGHILEVVIGEEPEAIALLEELASAIVTPLRAESFVCGSPEDNTLERVKEVMPGILRRPDLRSPPELVYLHRTLGGVYGMLRKLGHHGRYGAFQRRHARHAIAVAEGRVQDRSPVPEQ